MTGETGSQNKRRGAFKSRMGNSKTLVGMESPDDFSFEGMNTPVPQPQKPDNQARPSDEHWRAKE